MIKKTLIISAIALFTLASTVFAAGAAAPGFPGNPAPVAPSITVTADEAASLQYMREEEKLAHDVYIALADEWDLRVFENIARAEQQHSDATAYWLGFYKLDDPAAGNAPGEFTNTELQALYDQLVTQGRRSAADALKVGAAIEELDIRDLQEATAGTANPALTRLYQNLKAGSEKHLRAFATNLRAQTGATYAPQYLSQVEYAQIVGGSVQVNGNGRGSRRP